MEPMKPMAPIAPMKPMESGPAWWPEDLGEPTTSGGQGDRRYAFFARQRRLAVQQGEAVTVYDSGDHAITGASQRHGEGGGFTLEDANGEVSLDDLRKLP